MLIEKDHRGFAIFVFFVVKTNHYGTPRRNRWIAIDRWPNPQIAVGRRRTSHVGQRRVGWVRNFLTIIERRRVPLVVRRNGLSAIRPRVGWRNRFSVIRRQTMIFVDHRRIAQIIVAQPRKWHRSVWYPIPAVHWRPSALAGWNRWLDCRHAILVGRHCRKYKSYVISIYTYIAIFMVVKSNGVVLFHSRCIMYVRVFGMGLPFNRPWKVHEKTANK